MSQSNAGAGSVRWPMVIIAVLALIAIFVWLGYSNFGPPPPPPLNPAAQQVADQLRTLAKKCHGDITKLTPEEQTKAQRLCAGNAVSLLQAYAKE